MILALIFEAGIQEHPEWEEELGKSQHIIYDNNNDDAWISMPSEIKKVPRQLTDNDSGLLLFDSMRDAKLMAKRLNEKKSHTNLSQFNENHLAPIIVWAAIAVEVSKDDKNTIVDFGDHTKRFYFRQNEPVTRGAGNTYRYGVRVRPKHQSDDIWSDYIL